MLFYTFIFILSTFFFYLSSNRKSCINAYAIIAILIPSFVAGFRDLSVGVDTELLFPVYKSIVTQTSISGAIETANTEFFYILLGYVSKHLGGYPFFLFVCQLLTISFVYSFVFRNKQHIYVWLAMLLYFCFFYNFSLNIMRQFVAIAYVLCISNYLLAGRIKKYFVLSLLSVIFHTSAIIGCTFLYLIYALVNASQRNKYILIPIYVSLLLFLYLFFQNLGPILEAIPIGRFSEYVHYLSGDGFISATDFTYRAIFVAIWFASVKYSILPKYINQLYFLLIITEIALLLLGLYAHYTYRIALYLTVFHIVYLSFFCKCGRLTFASKCLCAFIVILMSYIYWFYLQVVVDNGTLPYKIMNYSQ